MKIIKINTDHYIKTKWEVEFDKQGKLKLV